MREVEAYHPYSMRKHVILLRILRSKTVLPVFKENVKSNVLPVSPHITPHFPLPNLDDSLNNP